MKSRGSPNARRRSLCWIAALLLANTSFAIAQQDSLHPQRAPAEPLAFKLGTGGVANQAADEGWFRQWGVPMVHNVSTATLTPFLPAAGKGNGAAIIVAPGGGFRWLSIDNEGWRGAQALVDQGVAALVPKYRLLPTPESLRGLKDSMN